MPVHCVDVEATKKLQDALEATKEQLAAGAGLALAAWTTVEIMLTFVFVALMDRSSKRSAEGFVPWDAENLQRRLYHTILNTIISFDVRVDMVGAAIEESDLRKDLKALWPNLGKRLKKGYKSRHEAAHFMFDQIQQEDGSLVVLLAPFPTTVVNFEEAKRLNRKQLDEKRERFEAVIDALRWYWSAIEIQRKRQKGPRPPAPALIQHARQVAKTRTPQASLSPPQSSEG